MKRGLLLLCLLFCLHFPSEASSPVVFATVWDVDEGGFRYFGVRPLIYDKGIYFLSNYLFDFNWPAMGGIKTRNFPVHQYLLDFQVGIEAEKLIHLKGARFFLAFQYHQTDHPTLNYVGDWQSFDNMNAPNFIELAQLWYEQKLWNNKIAVRFGKIDAYTLFNYASYAQFLLNNSFTQIPTIIAFPTYPFPAVGVVLEYYPLKWISFHASIFDGSQALGVNTGAIGSRNFFNNLGQHANLLNEIRFNWASLSECYKGVLGLGFWGLTATLPNHKGGSVKGTTGAYGYLNQTLWKEDFFSKRRDREHLRECGGFLQWGVCSKEINDIKEYFGAGLAFQNLTKELEDSLSLGMATVLFSNATGAFYPKHYEMALDLTYQIYILDYFMIQPDLQYIIHPGGQGLRNALVGTLRLMASL